MRLQRENRSALHSGKKSESAAGRERTKGVGEGEKRR